MAVTINVLGSYNDKDIKRAMRDLESLGAASGDTSKSFGEHFAAMGESMERVGRDMTTKVTLPILGAGAAVFAMFSKQEDAVARMTGALNANGGQANVTADEIMDLASSLQETTTFGDEATISAAGLLLTFHKVRNEFGEGNRIFDRTLVAAQDLSAALGTDLESSTMQLAKALENPVQGMSALSRSGTTFTQEQKDMVKAMEESGDTLGAQKLILDVVEGQYAGMAETMANTSSGQIKQAFNSIGDAMEDFGAIIAPVITKVVGKFKQLGEMVQRLSPEHKELIVQVLAVAAAIGPLLLVGGKLIKMVMSITKVMHLMKIAFLTNPVGLIVMALVGLVAILAVAYTRFEGFRNFVDKVWQGVQQVISRVWEGFIKPVFEQLVASFNEQIMPALQDLFAAFQEVWPGIQAAIVAAWEFIAPILEKIVEILIFVYSVVLVALIKYWTFVFTKVVQIVTLAISVIGPIFAAIVSFISDKIVPAAQGMWSTMQTVWAAVSGAVTTAWGVLSSIFTSIKDGIAGVADWVGDKASAITGFFSGIGDGIKDAFRSAFNFVARAWNNTIGKISFEIPSWVPGGLGGKEFSVQNIPEFAKGGIVPGIQGAPMLAVVHGGEQILRPSEAAGGGGGDTYNITVNGMVGKDKRDVLEFLARELPKAAASHARSFG